MTIALLLIQLGLGAMFVASGASKLLQADEFAAALRLSRLPEPLVAVLAVGVPVVEIALSAWLFMAQPRGLQGAFLACTALLALFTAWMLWVGARKLTVRCGCFGAGGGYVGSRTISRNLALIGFALSGWQLAEHAISPLSGISLGAAIAWSSLAMAVVLLQAARLAVPHMTLTYDQFRDAGTAEME
ncbi:MAG: MauE/DoxX family redox-associated membrane protein [Chloroflexota bacterium]